MMPGQAGQRAGATARQRIYEKANQIEVMPRYSASTGRDAAVPNETTVMSVSWRRDVIDATLPSRKGSGQTVDTSVVATRICERGGNYLSITRRG
jgi:hypothetical protein